MLKTKLTTAALRYDQRQEKRKGYNHYALPQYLQRIDQVCADVARGATPHDAIVAGFTGPLRTAMLKAIGERADYTETGALTYAPVKR